MATSLRDLCLVYDQEFNDKMKIAKFLVKNLHEKKDTQLANKWLIRVGNIKSPVLEVKKNRNAFLTYIIKVLGDGVLTGCSGFEGHSATTVCDPDNSLAAFPDADTSYFSEAESADEPPTRHQPPEEPEKDEKMHFQSRWSKDHRIYSAVKPIPGRGVLVYLATSKNPGIHSWDLPTKKKKQRQNQ